MFCNRERYRPFRGLNLYQMALILGLAPRLYADVPLRGFLCLPQASHLLM
jgi:hypothetical protein